MYATECVFFSLPFKITLTRKKISFLEQTCHKVMSIDSNKHSLKTVIFHFSSLHLGIYMPSKNSKNVKTSYTVANIENRKVN